MNKNYTIFEVGVDLKRIIEIHYYEMEIYWSNLVFSPCNHERSFP
jgi:hypothetical protein